MSELIAALQDALSEKAPKVPPGWKTVKQWAEDEGRSRPRMQSILASLVEMKKVEMKMFPVKFAHFTRMTPHYRLKK